MKEAKDRILQEFEDELDADGGMLRFSTKVEPRLCDAEKTKKWLSSKLDEFEEELKEGK